VIVVIVKLMNNFLKLLSANMVVDSLQSIFKLLYLNKSTVVSVDPLELLSQLFHVLGAENLNKQVQRCLFQS
jgi:hypothetical protein